MLGRDAVTCVASSAECTVACGSNIGGCNGTDAGCDDDASW
jgi:hypothetical protein